MGSAKKLGKGLRIAKKTLPIAAGVVGGVGGGIVGAKEGPVKAVAGAVQGARLGYTKTKELMNYDITKKSPTAKYIASLKKGGRIRKTGLYKLHKGELVVPKEKVHAYIKKRK